MLQNTIARSAGARKISYNANTIARGTKIKKPGKEPTEKTLEPSMLKLNFWSTVAKKTNYAIKLFARNKENILCYKLLHGAPQ